MPRLPMRLPVLCIALLGLSGTATAQVGHPPEKSPFRDIDRKFSLTALYGHLSGDGGKIGVGPHDGPTYGGRLELALGAPLAIALTASHGDFVRDILVLDPTDTKLIHRSVDQSMLMIEAALQLNLTGRKTWHRLAPFLGISAGWANASETASAIRADSTGYEFGSEFYWSPSAGTRLFLTRRLYLRGDARYVSWKLKLPQTALDLLPDHKVEQWDGNFEWRVGLGFAF